MRRLPESPEDVKVSLFGPRRKLKRHLNIRMGRRAAPGKKRKVHCSPEPIRATLPSSPVHNVSASRSQNNAERNHQLEPLSGNLSNVILLSMLEKLDAKLDNLQNTLEDVPSRVAGLTEQIWIARGQYHLDNDSVSSEVVSPVRDGEYSVSRSDEKEPDEQELLWFDREGPQQNHCIHPAFQGGAITTDPSERGNMESDVLLFKAIPAPQSRRESLNGKEIQHASAGRKNFAHRMNEKKHQRSHKSESSNNDALLGPKRKQSGPGAYPCAECTKTFTGKTHLLQHEKTHTGLRQCPYPEQETRSADEATLIHHEITHKGVRPFHCNICEKSFTQKGNLQRHHRTHTGEKPYQCSLCFMRFASKESLVFHHTIHTRVKPYHCPVCGKGFDRKERLAGHQSTHPGEKPYQCSVCAKRFNHKKTLAHHQITHRRPFHCSECPKSFDCKDRLLGHQRIHTGKRYVAAQGMKTGLKKRRLLSNIK
ncbi:zinc finger protein 605-like isoform X1 [Pleurodeles waltl]